MLIKCPECKSQVSDKAYMCPACGYPMKRQIHRSTPGARLPNGFGSITRLSSRRLRKPYLARVTVGKNEVGKPIVRNLRPTAYFKTYNEAYKALVDFNLNPYSFDRDLTVKEVLDLFMKEFGKKDYSEKHKNAVRRAYDRSSSLFSLRFRDIRPRHIKECMDVIDGEYEKRRFKGFWSRAYDYAMEYELAERNYAKVVKCEEVTTKKPGTAHMSFTDDEMSKLWENAGDETVNMILIQCYMGWRPNELCSLTTDSVNLDKWYMVGGSKTDAGRDRVVPIHSKIRPMIHHLMEERVKEGRKLLFTIDGEAVDYFRYRYYFKKVMKRLGLREGHKPHDCRKQFITMAKRYKVDEYVIKLVVGHAISDITESVYTDRDVENLSSEIEKIIK